MPREFKPRPTPVPEIFSDDVYFHPENYPCDLIFKYLIFNRHRLTNAEKYYLIERHLYSDLHINEICPLIEYI
jgi:hypothetical protein